jgi:hypothetical protein
VETVRFLVRALLFIVGGLFLLAGLFALDPFGWRPSLILLALGAVLILGALLMLSAETEERKVLRRLLYVGSALAAGAVALAIIAFADRPDHCDEFDAEEFREGDSDSRGDYSDLLLRCDIVEGRTRAQVVEMLGKPDGHISSPRGASWIVGTSFLDAIYLVVRFEDGRATDVFERRVG